MKKRVPSACGFFRKKKGNFHSTNRIVPAHHHSVVGCDLPSDYNSNFGFRPKSVTGRNQIAGLGHKKFSAQDEATFQIKSSNSASIEHKQVVPIPGFRKHKIQAKKRVFVVAKQ